MSFMLVRHLLDPLGMSASSSRGRKPSWWFVTGVLAAALYVSMTMLVGKAWADYSVASQTISELSAIDAPTRPLWLGLIAVYSLLMIAFGVSLWKSAASSRALRAVGALLTAQCIFGLFWPPMHQRVVLAASGRTMTDTLHIVWTIVTSVFFMVALAVGAGALGRRFRAYSIVTLIVVFASGALTGSYASRLEANLPTPWAGVWERIDTTAFMAWIAVLAINVWRRPRENAIAAASVGERLALPPI